MKDEDLAARAAGGDDAAAEQLVRKYATPVRRVCRAILADPEDADDAAQEALLNALTRLGTYDPDRPFGPWLMRVAANVARDHLRRRRVRRTEGIPEGVADSGEEPDRLAERASLRNDLAAALEQLPERQRAAVVLFDVEGYSHQEIAEVLGVPVGTVRSDVFHARRKLRELVGRWQD